MMSLTRRLFVPAVAMASVALAADAMTPAGLWKTIDDKTGQPRSFVRIVPTPSGYEGRVAKILPMPDDDPANPDHLCRVCTDERKDKPILGMVILRGLKPDGDVFAGGEILDPNNGKTYRCKLTVKDGGKRLDVRGFIGISLIGRTQSWLREE